MQSVLPRLIYSVAIAAIVTAPARAADVTSNFVNGTLGATAVFHDAGNGDLQITLTNTGGDVQVPSDLLGALFFNCSCGTLTPISATLTGGSMVLFGGDGGGNVGGEWAYGANMSAPNGATRGISAVGFGLFGQPNFNGPDLDNHASLGGMDYTLTSVNDDPTTGNTPVTGTNALIQSSVSFMLGGFNGNMSFSNTSFQYGTDLSEPNFTGIGTGAGTGTGTGTGAGQTLVPEPGSLLLFGSGLALSAIGLRRRRSPHGKRAPFPALKIRI